MNKIIFSLFMCGLSLNACHSTVDNAAAAGNPTTGSAQTTPDGQLVFKRNCVSCHGIDGKLGLNGAKDLSISEQPLDARVQIVTQGKNLMTPFKALLTEAEIKAVAEYSMSLKVQGTK